MNSSHRRVAFALCGFVYTSLPLSRCSTSSKHLRTTYNDPCTTTHDLYNVSAMFPRGPRFPAAKGVCVQCARTWPLLTHLSPSQRLKFQDPGHTTHRVCPSVNLYCSTTTRPADPDYDAYKRGAFLEKTNRFDKDKPSDVPGEVTTGHCKHRWLMICRPRSV